MKKNKPAPGPFDKELIPLIFALLGALAGGIFFIPPWIFFWCIILWLYAGTGVAKGFKRPGRPTLIILTLMGFSGILISFRGAFASDAYMGILAVMAGLKPLEVKSYRDRIVTVFLAYFIIIANLLNSDSIGMIFYMFFSVFLTTSVLIHLNSPGKILKDKAKLSGTMMAQAIPIMIVLFFMFPRIQGGFLGFVRRAGGTSGLSDTISPGSISGLVPSRDIAFRVKFHGPLPDPDKRYFRALVFSVFDGRAWHVQKQVPKLFRPLKGSDKIEYTITMEPDGKKWLFALDMPAKAPETGLITGNHTIMAKRKITAGFVYAMASYLKYNTGPLRKWESVNFILPGPGNPKARRLAAKWRKTYESPEKIIGAAIEFFSKNGFKYTLSPPVSGKDSIDNLLFVSKKGYCEHYACAMAFLLRAAKIPARIVGGYLGGEVNPYGDYLIVRQADAHAWVEAWISQKGWIRIDPTLFVAPERIEQGLRYALSGDDLRLIDYAAHVGIIWDVLKKLRLGWDSVNTYWTLWIMGYGVKKQQSLFVKLGFDDLSWKAYFKAILIAFGLIGGFIIFFAVGIYKKQSIKSDPVKKAYDIFCKKLAKKGFVRKPGQGPLDFMEQAIRKMPEAEKEIRAITKIYILARYGNKKDEKTIKKLKMLVGKFNPDR